VNGSDIDSQKQYCCIYFWESVYYIGFVHMQNLLWANFVNDLKCTSPRFIKTVLFS